MKSMWDKVRTEPTGDYTLFYGNGNENNELGKRIIFLDTMICNTLNSVRCEASCHFRNKRREYLKKLN
jgi:hypothetical protein